MNHAITKTLSRVDMKQLYPQCTREEYASLELMREGTQLSLVLWYGKSEDHCQGNWWQSIPQARQRAFEIPGIPFRFIVVSNKIYYRRNVE